MVTQQLAKDYLHSMGIISWQRRSLANVSSCWRVGSHCVVITAMIKGTHKNLQQQVWQNICNVFCYCEPLDVPPADATVIQLGPSRTSAAGVMVTHSLADCILQPSLKKDVWDVIKNQITG